MAIARGSGASLILPLIEAFLRQDEHQSTTRATNGGVEVDRRANMRVILATRDWFEQAITELLSDKLNGYRSDQLSVEIHYTGNDE